jgi:hypothetical protein
VQMQGRPVNPHQFERVVPRRPGENAFEQDQAQQEPDAPTHG